MVKIQGTFFDVSLQIRSNSNYLDLQISKWKDQIYSKRVVHFDDIKQKLTLFFNKNEVFIPVPRKEAFFLELENSFLNLTQSLQSSEDDAIETQKATAEALSYAKRRSSSGNPSKVLIMGMGNAGKTSIFHVLFRGKLPHETIKLNPTRGVERHFLNFSLNPNGDTNSIMNDGDESKENLENSLTIWDLGGQEAFLDRYNSDPEQIFGETALLIFVIDAFDVDNYEVARKQLHNAIENMKTYALENRIGRLQQSTIICFIHKMDQFQDRKDKYKNLTQYFGTNPATSVVEPDVRFLSTSIYDSSLFRAWAKSIHSIIPKSSKLNVMAQELKRDLGTYVVIIIEKRTGLPIANSKTLLETGAIVGSTSRILITLDRVISDFQLSEIEKVQVTTPSGILDIRIFGKYYLLVMIYAEGKNMDTPDNKKMIEKFMKEMHASI